MNMSSLKAFCFSILLLYVRADGQAANHAFESLELSEVTTAVSDVSSRGRELTQSGPSFSQKIDAAVDECQDGIYYEACSYKKSRQIKDNSATGTYKKELTWKNCCCACRHVENCNALQYHTLDQECIFHYGGSPKFRLALFRRSWIK